MQEFKNRVQAIIDTYEPQFTAKEIEISLSKRYFETEAPERTTNTGVIEHAWNRKQEKRYKRVNNRYHCLVLSVFPVDKRLLQREYGKDYAFVLRKVERAHIGDKPLRFVYEQDRVLAKIEKRIRKILKRAEKHPPRTVCKDTLWDVFRYVFSGNQYGYRKRVLGKDRHTWDMIFTVGIGVLGILLVLLLWSIGQ